MKKNDKNPKKKKNTIHESIDRPRTNKKRELLLGLVIQTMVYRYLGVRDKTSEGGWKLPFMSLEGYDSSAPRYFEDERIEILFHGWKNYVKTHYGKEMNSLGMSAVMQNQVRKAFKLGELQPLFKPCNDYHKDVVERIVCKPIESLLEHHGLYEIRSKTDEVLYG